ncbi:hypothetical protein DAPPUDRAFT_330274 [Daphnia pulex]|uniref:Replication protein A OB domain-containing protein n=1 Tax=Daphnia pulex TaxID=6669 RepID=E9HJ30_DAPPU|nr:hypothetical protein DAPPUDRAFT_330274 [Daphnia pulex]|eukprot:EFX68248.1 hypothetical protein DAPPUDRAFT_330274 [Daphnia pulex]
MDLLGFEPRTNKDIRAPRRSLNPLYHRNMSYIFDLFNVGVILGKPKKLVVGEVTEEAAEKPTITFNFVPFDQLTNLENISIVDVIGLVLHLQEKVLVETKTTKISRSLTAEFVDSTNTEVRLHSLFNYRGSLLEKVADKCIVALSGVKISNKFGRRYLETLSSTVVQINPDMTEVRELREWTCDFTQKSDAFFKLGNKEFHKANNNGLRPLRMNFDPEICKRLSKIT